MVTGRARILLGCLLAIVVIARGEAHKTTIISKYTYNDDVFPILRERCGRCHVAGGVAPMSLLTYKDAFPWAESIRGELIAGHMPPWNADDGVGRFRNRPAMAAREIDTVLTWATDGTPVGSPLHEPPPSAVSREWPMGAPGLVLPLPAAYEMPADTSDEVREFTLGTSFPESRLVRAVDLLPGTPAIVRNATVALKAQPETILAVWLPGEDPVPTAMGTAFALPAGAELLVRIHYKKSYTYEGQAMTDRSSVGLYFATGPATPLRTWVVGPAGARSERVTFDRSVDEDLEALAIHADPSLTNARFEVDVVAADGKRTPVIRFAARPDWTRRYWFEPPLALARGSRVEVVAAINGADGLVLPTAVPTPPQSDGSVMRLSLDVVPARAAR